MNFSAIYKVSVIYINYLVIREYLFFVLHAVNVSVGNSYPKQCLTLMFLDARHWASECDKSLAHEDKPLIKEKLR